MTESNEFWAAYASFDEVDLADRMIDAEEDHEMPQLWDGDDG